MKNIGRNAKKGELAVVETMNDIFSRNVPSRQIDDADEAINIVNVLGGEPESWSSAEELTVEESTRFLRIVTKTLQVNRHYELFALMQGEVQHFIRHEILISAWGDFRTWDLTLDVISALPRVRTGQLNGCSIDSHCSINNLLKSVHERWVALGRRPLLLNNGWDEHVKCTMSNCDPNGVLQSMGAILVHGVHDLRDGIDSLYVALNPGPILNGYRLEHFNFLIDTLIGQIDVAFRKVAGLKFAHTTAQDDPIRNFGHLSAREKEIMELVSQGRTNLEIAANLGISTFTVKNHVQRILRKLGATNRTEAAAKQSQMV